MSHTLSTNLRVRVKKKKEIETKKVLKAFFYSLPTNNNTVVKEVYFHMLKTNNFIPSFRHTPMKNSSERRGVIQTYLKKKISKTETLSFTISWGMLVQPIHYKIDYIWFPSYSVSKWLLIILCISKCSLVWWKQKLKKKLLHFVGDSMEERDFRVSGAISTKSVKSKRLNSKGSALGSILYTRSISDFDTTVKESMTQVFPSFFPSRQPIEYTSQAKNLAAFTNKSIWKLHSGEVKSTCIKNMHIMQYPTKPTSGHKTDRFL